MIEKNIDLKTYSPLTLAFIGDGVYDLFVREYIVTKENAPVKKLHEHAVKMVRCDWQARVIKEVLMDILSDEEKNIYTRGRNAKVNSVPKNSKPADYHAATGFEALIGYLYLGKRQERIDEFFNLIIKFYENQEV